MNKENWILCKDRLPTKLDCLNYDTVTDEHFDCFWVTILQNSCGLTYTARMCYRPERNLWYQNGANMSAVDASKIVAWMPIIVPKAYQLPQDFNDCNFDGCKKGLHPFKVIENFEFGDESKVVRWCPECGAIVVDSDCDGRTNPGYYKKLQYPNITKKHGLE